MLTIFRRVIWFLTKLLLWTRYRVRVRGAEQVRNLRGPTLILPNHPGYTDPVLVMDVLWPLLHPRPLVYQGTFKNPILWPLLKLLKAIAVPNLEQASMQARSQAEQALTRIIDALHQGSSVILWPAGHLSHNGAEELGGARAVTDILSAVPELNVVVVRTRGLWGSSFSWAMTGEHPKLGRAQFKAFGWLLLNLFLLMPRRTIEMTLKRVDRSELPDLNRDKINRWLENWYNTPGPGPEKPTFVPYHLFLGPRTFEYPKLADMEEIDLRKVKPATKTAIAEMLSDKLHRPLTEQENAPETTLDQLGIDSLDRMELTLAIEHRFGFSGARVPASVGQLWALAQGLVEKGPIKPPPPEWFRPSSNQGPLAIVGDTLAEAFVNRALACRRDVVAADDLSGVLTYERMLVGALTMAKRLRDLPGDNVGLMMPASVAGDVALLALHLAGKLPVLLNWTTGPGNLAHAARVMNLQNVVTSHRFLDRSGVTIEGVDFVFLEELRQEVGKAELLRTLLRVRYLPGGLRARVPRPAPDAPAVVLFTSGSEKAPKAVPLTHRNLISNQRAAITFFDLTGKDSILGFLPAFHSFGVSVTGLLPILGGMRVLHHPDPADAGGLARKIAAYRPTLMAATPTFFNYILDRVEPGGLDSLRLIVMGAEKVPLALLERGSRLAPRTAVMEGYGITECSPVVASNRIGENRPGTVGKPFPGVELRVVDLETRAPLPAGQLGMLLVSGLSVFPGYIAHEGPQPFEEHDGKRWYVTGDLVQIDDDGYIHFSGRLKRFLKAGGEMISLPALEEPFARQYPPTREGPRVAVEGVETEEGRHIVLFTTEPITLREANARLQEEGFRGILRLDEVRRLDAIPVLGTGKTDYKALRALILHDLHAHEGSRHEASA